MRIAPIVIAESATLNVGKSPTWTKSTTAPFRNPGVRNRRSIRLPTRAAEHQREPDHHQRVAGAAHRAHEDDRHHDGDDGEEGRERLEEAERAARVAHQHEADVVADQPHRVVGQLADGPPLAELVEEHDPEDDRRREQRTAGACRACGSMGCAVSRGSSASLGTSLAVDAGLGVRQGLETLEVDAATGGDAQPVGAVGDALQRAVDLVDGLLGRRREQQVALALDVDGVALARLLVELGVAALALGRRAGRPRPGGWRPT